MSLPAAVFAAEERAHWRRVADEAALEAAFLRMEEAAFDAMKRRAGESWARVLMTRGTSGRLWEVLLYSPVRDHRARAAALLCADIRAQERAA